MTKTRTKSSSPAPSPARSTRRPCRRTCRSRRDQIAEQAIEAARGRRRDPAPARARTRRTAARRPTRRSSSSSCRASRPATDAVINITTGGSTRMTLEERLAYPLQAKPEMCSLNMGSMNFSIHPAARKITEWKLRLGEALRRGHGGPDLPQHLPRHQAHPARRSAKTAAPASSSSATTSATSTTWPTSSTRAWSSGRSSSRASSASWAGMGADPENLVIMRTHRRPAVRPRELPLLGARRRAPPDAAAHDGRHDGRQRARRPGGQPLPRPGQLASSVPSRCARSAASSTSCRWRWRRPPRRARCWA